MYSKSIRWNRINIARIVCFQPGNSSVVLAEVCPNMEKSYNYPKQLIDSRYRYSSCAQMLPHMPRFEAAFTMKLRWRHEINNRLYCKKRLQLHSERWLRFPPSIYVYTCKSFACFSALKIGHDFISCAIDRPCLSHSSATAACNARQVAATEPAVRFAN